MATLKIDTKKIIGNIEKLSEFLSEKKIEWSLVTKLLGGNREVLTKLLQHPSILKVHSLADSRISNLKAIKEIKPDIVTMYIKPPALSQVKNIIKYADISLNSSYKTIEALSKEACRVGKKHRVVIMIEMGELREGVLRDNVLDFYENAFKLENIIIEGIGTNLGCMYGIEPSYDKMIQLSLYEQLIEAKFNQNIELISAGSSITLPLTMKNKIPDNVNHFRIGESVFFGSSPLDDKKFKNLSTNVFDFAADILEIEKKDYSPDGNMSEGNVGHTAEIKSEFDQSYKCLVDFGEVDVNVQNLLIKDSNIKFIGTTSDMTVFDLGQTRKNYRVGGQLHFKPNYMAAAHLMNTNYVTKKIV